MRKKILLTVLALLAATGAFAQFHQKKGDPVDYSLIRLPRADNSYPVTYTMSFEHFSSEDFFYDIMYYFMTGDKSEAEKDNIGWTDIVFTGELRHTRDVSPEMLEAAIQKALLQTGLNSRQMLALRQEQARLVAPIIYSNKDFLKDLAGAVLFAIPLAGEATLAVGGAVTAAGVALSAVNLAEGASDAIHEVADITSLSLTAAQQHNALLKWLSAGEPFADATFQSTGKVLGRLGTAASVASMGITVYDWHKRDRQKWLNREGAAALWQVNSFYGWCNYYLDQIARASAKDAWVLLIDSSSEPADYMFRNTPCDVTWSVSAKLVKYCSLPRRPDRMNYDYEGEYCGILDAVSVYDLSNYTNFFLQSWGNWTEDYLLQGKGFKAPGSFGSGNFRDMGMSELDEDPRWWANYMYNDPWQNGSKLNSWKASAAMACVYHIPVYFKIEQTSSDSQQPLEGPFVHMMWMNKDDFEGVEVARSLGFSETNPDQMYTTDLALVTEVDGIEFPRKGPIPATRITIKESIRGDEHHYSKVVTGTEKDVVEQNIKMRNEHGFIDIELPEGSIKIDLSAILAPTIETVPQDRKNWEKIKEKWF